MLGSFVCNYCVFEFVCFKNSYKLLQFYINKRLIFSKEFMKKHNAYANGCFLWLFHPKWLFHPMCLHLHNGKQLCVNATSHTLHCIAFTALKIYPLFNRILEHTAICNYLLTLLTILTLLCLQVRDFWRDVYNKVNKFSNFILRYKSIRKKEYFVKLFISNY